MAELVKDMNNYSFYAPCSLLPNNWTAKQNALRSQSSMPDGVEIIKLGALVRPTGDEAKKRDPTPVPSCSCFASRTKKFHICWL